MDALNNHPFQLAKLKAISYIAHNLYNEKIPQNHLLSDSAGFKEVDIP
jgi:hypothetical protein